MLGLLKGWSGSMDKDSVAATVYSFMMNFFQTSLFHAQVESDTSNRILYTDNYLFNSIKPRIVEMAANDGSKSIFNPLCRKGFEDYEYKEGGNHCAYNLARSFVAAKQYLSENVSPRSEDWKWGSLIVKDWVNLPWSRTPLKPFFHRQAATQGNVNTVDVSRYFVNFNDTLIHSTQGAVYRQIIEMGPSNPDENDLFSLDTGINENPLQGNYFDMNAHHRTGQLNRMLPLDQLDQSEMKHLKLMPPIELQDDHDEL